MTPESRKLRPAWVSSSWTFNGFLLGEKAFTGVFGVKGDIRWLIFAWGGLSFLLVACARVGRDFVSSAKSS